MDHLNDKFWAIFKRKVKEGWSLFGQELNRRVNEIFSPEYFRPRNLKLRVPAPREPSEPREPNWSSAPRDPSYPTYSKCPPLVWTIFIFKTIHNQSHQFTHDWVFRFWYYQIIWQWPERWWCNGQHWCLPSIRSGFDSRPSQTFYYTNEDLGFLLALNNYWRGDPND